MPAPAFDHRLQRLSEAGYAIVRETNKPEGGGESWSVIRTTSPTDRPSRVLGFVAPDFSAAVAHVAHWARSGGIP